MKTFAWMRRLLALVLLVASALAMAQGAPATRSFDHIRTGYPLTGQHLNERCESCHINGIFNGTPRDCASCHTAGTRWSRSNVVKGQNHIPTQLACDSCHNTRTYAGARFNHAGVTAGSCTSCHNGSMAPGKPGGHHQTTDSCDTCHRSSAWTPASGFTTRASRRAPAPPATTAREPPARARRTCPWARPAATPLVSRFVRSGYFDLVATEERADDVDPWLVTAKAQLGLVIGPGFGKALDAGRTARLQLVVDGSDATTANIALGYAASVARELGAEVQQRRLRAAGAGAARAGEAVLLPRVLYNPDLKSRWFYVPAVLALILMVMTMILSAMGVVREKEIGTLEQIIVTPIRAWQLLVGKLLPFAVIGFVQVLLVSAITVWGFGVPIRCSFLLLLALTQLFILNTLELGLLVSTLVRTQQQAMMTAAFTMMLPMVYLSGLIFPIENMPRIIQTVTYAIPLRYYAVIIRGVFLKGIGFGLLWPQMAGLAALAAVMLLLASWRVATSTVAGMLNLPNVNQPAAPSVQETAQAQREMHQGLADPWIRGIEAAEAYVVLGDVQAAARFYASCVGMPFGIDWLVDACLSAILRLGPSRAFALLDWMVKNPGQAAPGAGFGSLTGGASTGGDLDPATVQVRKAGLEGLGRLVGGGALSTSQREQAMQALLGYADSKQNEPYFAGAAAGLGAWRDPRAIEPL